MREPAGWLVGDPEGGACPLTAPGEELGDGVQLVLVRATAELGRGERLERQLPQSPSVLGIECVGRDA
jgi:hypothetical protein